LQFLFSRDARCEGRGRKYCHRCHTDPRFHRDLRLAHGIAPPRHRNGNLFLRHRVYVRSKADP
jgi:hypothetical protein